MRVCGYVKRVACGSAAMVVLVLTIKQVSVEDAEVNYFMHFGRKALTMD